MLRLALLWHMHQPFYLDRVEGRFALPWTRLHSLKDYLDMPLAIARRPGQAANVNLVPSLIEQWLAWRDGRQDRVEELCAIPATALSEDERGELLSWLFRAQAETMIAALEPYRRLHVAFREGGARAIGAAELTQLKFWFHLAWLDPSFRGEALPARLIADPARMNEEGWPEFKAWLDGFPDRLLEAYPRLHREGAIEISLSPFYHPILPLIVDSDTARELQPDDALPSRFRAPEDARWQLRSARRFARRELGLDVAGLWPSEGGVSEAAMALAADEGYRWAATDEAVLARSLGLPDLRLPPAQRAERLYRPYRRRHGEGELALLFRDHFLSDRIGFSYASWEPERAVADFLAQLRRIAAVAPQSEPLVTVCLDGENCWEHYAEDGGPFLAQLYAALDEAADIRLDSIGRHLEEMEPLDLERLAPGSWIDGRFSIWIGHPEDNRSWEALSRVRGDLVAASGGGPPDDLEAAPPRLAAAWRALFAAEGSDWNWWYGDDHGSEDDAAFDAIYRGHLAAVYEALGRPVPDFLLRPLAAGSRRRGALQPLGLSRIQHDGRVSHFYEWENAARWTPEAVGGAMTRVDHLLQALHLAFGREALHLRLDLRRDHPAWPELRRVSLEIHRPEALRFRFLLAQGQEGAERERMHEADRRWRREDSAATSRVGDIVELRIPWGELPARPGQEIRFALTLLGKAGILDLVPTGHELHFILPDEFYDRIMWNV